MAMTRGQHLIGKVLGSCVLEKCLGYGGSGAVFLAQQKTPERKVAIKVFLPRSAMDARMRRNFYRRFLHEAEAASKLVHPNILPIFSYGEQDGLPYIIMPYMPGGTLLEYIVNHGPLSLLQAQAYIAQIAAALDYAHEQGCVHCDVKPANILLDHDGHVVLSDFGIARILQAERKGTPSTIDGSGSLLGTPDYLSPEQALGRYLDGRTDIYSLGVTLFYLLTRQLPFKADSILALALLHVYETPPSLVPMCQDVTPTIDRVIHKALAKNPNDRFQTAGALSTALTDALAVAERKSSSTYNKRSNAGINGNLVSQGDRPRIAPLPYKLLASLKSLSRYSARRMFFFGIMASLLVIIGSVVFSAKYASTNSLDGIPHKQTPTITRVDHTFADYLADHANWPTSSAYFFDDQQQDYHIINTSAKNVALALYNDHQFSNFRLSVTMQEIHRSNSAVDYYGVVFRSALDETQYYVFEVTSAGGGQYAFLRFDNQWSILASGSAPTLLTDRGKSNTIALTAHNNTFAFKINGQSVGKSVVDTSKFLLTRGQVGLYVEDQGAEVIFSRLLVDVLP